MRFDSALKIALLALAVAAAGCATRSEPPVTKAAVAPAPAISAAAPAPAPKLEAEPPISAAVQRAFDDARRAMQAGRTDEAERGFRALTKSSPELGGPHANLGLLLRQSGKLTEAAAELELAVKANPKQPVYLNQLGITYRQQGEFQKARDAYERALLIRAMRGGGSRPARFDSETALVDALLADKSAVTYMWADRAAAWPNLKVVAELWQEN